MLALLSLSSCLPAIDIKLTGGTDIKLTGGTAPSFIVSGTGFLGLFLIYGDEQQRDTHSDRDFAVWEFVVDGDWYKTARLNGIKKIDFGVVPPGYKQIYPEGGVKPSPLKEGVKYQYWFRLASVPEEKGYFQIKDGKAVVIPNS